MSTYKRLFLFAAYDANGIIDDALIYYVSSLAKYGDVIVCMDNDAKTSEINKLKKYTITTMAKKHGEYDFGSYKRAFIYAHDKKILDKYDYLYLVNDSVFGPMFDIQSTLYKLEHSGTDATGLVISKHKTHSFMESWFVCLNKKIFTSKIFNDFITSVHHEEYKYIITVKYEHGLTNAIKNNGFSWSGIYKYRGRQTYNRPKKLFKHGCPFIKKASFTRHNGALGYQINYVLNHSKSTAKKSVLKTAFRIFGKEYMTWFLTNNPLRAFCRNIRYLTKKIENG